MTFAAYETRRPVAALPDLTRTSAFDRRSHYNTRLKSAPKSSLHGLLNSIGRRGATHRPQGSGASWNVRQSATHPID